MLTLLILLSMESNNSHLNDDFEQKSEDVMIRDQYSSINKNHSIDMEERKKSPRFSNEYSSKKTEMIDIENSEIGSVHFDQVMPKESVQAQLLPLIEQIDKGELKPSELMFFFDFDDTLVMSQDKYQMNILQPKEQHPRTREMMELLKFLNTKHIPWCIVTSRGTKILEMTFAIDQYVLMRYFDFSTVYGDNNLFEQAKKDYEEIVKIFETQDAEKNKRI
jgi:hypothetical protein